MLPARIAVTIAAPNEPPTVRMTVLMPVAMPTSDCGTASTIRFAIAANANVMPAPSSMPRDDELPRVLVGEGVDQERAPRSAPAPIASTARKPIRAPSRAAERAGGSWASAVGISSSPAS